MLYHFTRTGALLSAVLSVLISTSTSSAVVIYDEAIDGDFADDMFNGVVLVLQQGENTVKGEVGKVVDPADGFRFVIPPDLIVKDLVVSIPNPLAIPDLQVSWTVQNVPGGPSITRFNFTEAVETPTSAKDLTPVEGPPLGDLADGIYGMRFKADLDPPYEVTFIVIPEPASAAVLTLGAMALLHRRS